MSLEMTVHRRRQAGLCRLKAGVPGMYNAYNVLAAAAVARRWTSASPTMLISRAIAAFKSAFGRIERIDLRGRTLTLALVKNPVGFNEVLRMLTMATDGLTVPTMIAINDRHADGRDVSWLWDVDFELLADGNRSADDRRHPRRGHGEPPQVRRRSRGSHHARSSRISGAAIDRFVGSDPEGRPRLHPARHTPPCLICGPSWRIAARSNDSGSNRRERAPSASAGSTRPR